MLAGHGIESELAVLARIGLDLDKFSVVVILSNPKIAMQMYGKGSYSLKRLLERLGCPPEKLHNAGNDSNYALRVLLVLFIESDLGESRGTERLALLPALQILVHAPLPEVSQRNEKARALRGRFDHGDWSDALESHFPGLDVTFRWD